MLLLHHEVNGQLQQLSLKLLPLPLLLLLLLLLLLPLPCCKALQAVIPSHCWHRTGQHWPDRTSSQYRCPMNGQLQQLSLKLLPLPLLLLLLLLLPLPCCKALQAVMSEGPQC
ncbi:hypothetical protein D4764_0116030 [Takifugu flavidus]|uniref:Uncharacterized protein n=1 Tax=Takifugu flavidus TaxID=433684 RepID=A0A5C6MED6_9TELE|nr:hypothetical protein D4764_0116030 [Takifugu flavidus]